MLFIAALALASALFAAEPTEVTGSHIRQKSKRVGMGTDTVQPVLVIDRACIDRTGAATVAELLRRIPQAHVRGF